MTTQPLPSQPAPSAPAGPLAGLLTAFVSAAADGSLVALVLSKSRSVATDSPARIDLRRIDLRGEPRVQIVLRHATRDVTRNVSIDEAARAVAGWLDGSAPDAGFAHATLRTPGTERQLLCSRKGNLRFVTRPTVRSETGAADADAASGADRHHDRRKRRHVPVESPFLVELGVTDPAHRVVAAMARKYRQIDKFVEIFDAAWRASPLAAAQASEPARPIEVVDFGCGKGYLTFAVFDHLRRQGVAARVIGVELRGELVEGANRAARRTGAVGLSFVAGDLASFRPERPIDITIALHACDTATDHALDLGIAAGAAMLIVAPCCHKELRPQLMLPAPLQPLLRHGVHLGQQAEMLTDALRVLALEASGYDAKLFEFVSLEHTSKNKMILATRHGDAGAAGGDAAAATPSRAKAEAAADALKRFWGIREQRLERLVRERAAARRAG